MSTHSPTAQSGFSSSISMASNRSTPEWLKQKFPFLHEEEFAKLYMAPLRTPLPDILIIDELNQENVTVSNCEKSYLDARQKLNAQLDRIAAIACDTGTMTADSRAARMALVYFIAHKGAPLIAGERENAVAKALGVLTALSKNMALSKEIFAYVSWLLSFGGDLPHSTKLVLISCLKDCLQNSQEKLAACLEKALILTLKEYDGAAEAIEVCGKLLELCPYCASARLIVLLEVIADTIDDTTLQQAAAAAAYDMRAFVESLQFRVASAT